MDNKKRYLKIKSVSQGSYYIAEMKPSQFLNLEDMMDDSEIDDGYELIIVEMTEKEYRSLPEFTGF